MKRAFSYTIYPNNSVERFKSACKSFESGFPDAEKKNLIVDVDGTTIQMYRVDKNEVVFFDDYDVGAVFVESDLNLSPIIEDYWNKEVNPIGFSRVTLA